MKQKKHLITDISGGFNRVDSMADMPSNESPYLRNQFPGLRLGIGGKIGGRNSIAPFPGCFPIPITREAGEICKQPNSLCLVRLGARNYDDYAGSLEYLAYLVSDEDDNTYFLLKTLFRESIWHEPHPTGGRYGGGGQPHPDIPDYPNLTFLGKDKNKAKVGEWGGSIISADSLGSMVVFAKDGLWVWPGAIKDMEEKFFSAGISPGRIVTERLLNPDPEKGEGFPVGSTVKWVITATKSGGWEFGTGISEVVDYTFGYDKYGMKLRIWPNTELADLGFDRIQIWSTEPNGYVFYFVTELDCDFGSGTPRYEDYGRRYTEKPLDRPVLNIPEANILKFYHRYLFIAGVKDHPNITYFSTIGQDGVPRPFTFHGLPDVSDFESELTYNFLDWQHDGDEVTAFGVGEPYVYIFKNNAIGWTRGGGAREFAMGQEIFLRGKGAPSQQAVTGDNQNVYFYCASDRKVYHLRGRNATDISWIIDQDWNHLVYHPHGLQQKDVLLSLYGNLLYLQFPGFGGSVGNKYPATCYVCDVDTVLAGKRPWWTKVDRDHYMFPMIDHRLIAPTEDVPSFYAVSLRGGTASKYPFYTHPAIGSWDATIEDDVTVIRRMPYNDFGLPGTYKRMNKMKFRGVLEKV